MAVVGSYTHVILTTCVSCALLNLKKIILCVNKYTWTLEHYIIFLIILYYIILLDNIIWIIVYYVILYYIILHYFIFTRFRSKCSVLPFHLQFKYLVLSKSKSVMIVSIWQHRALLHMLFFSMSSKWVMVVWWKYKTIWR